MKLPFRLSEADNPLSPQLLLLLLVIALGAYLALQIALNPEIGFLPPSFFGGNWILAPVDVADESQGMAAIFTYEFRVPEDDRVGASAIVDIAAARTYEFRLNGRLLSQPADRDPDRNWKLSQEFNLRDDVRNGKNLIEILVQNTNRPPALYVEGRIMLRSGARIKVESDMTWRVWSVSRTKQAAPESLPPPRDFYEGQYAERKDHAARINMLDTLATLSAYIVLGVAVFLYNRRQMPQVGHTGKLTGLAGVCSRIQVFIATRPLPKWVVVVALVALCFPMAAIRDPYEGWDALGHIEHLRYVASGRGVPTPDEGWQMYQPPAYYWVASLTYRVVLHWSAATAQRWYLEHDFIALKAVQLLTPAFVIIQVMLVLALIRYLFTQSALSMNTGAFVALLPVQIYFSSFISNETFSSLTVTAALLFLVRVVRGKRFGIVSSAALGLAVGVACLSKYSGLTLVMTTCFVYAVFLVIKVEQRRRMIISFLVASGVFFALTSPFYFRNIKKYGKALPVNTEFAKVNLEYFDLSFFLDPTRIGFGAVDKFVSRASSFVDGTYSSAWIDNSHKSYSWMKLFEVSIYYLGIFPTVITGAGFIRAIKGCRTDSENGRTYLVLSVMLIFGSFSYLYFILRFGTFEIVKAFYLLSWVSPISVFFELGRRDEIGPTRPSPVFAVPQLILYNFIIVYYLLVPVLKGAGT